MLVSCLGKGDPLIDVSKGPIQFLENNPIQSSFRVRFMCPNFGDWTSAAIFVPLRVCIGEKLLRSFCSPRHQDSALYPTITQLERAAGFRREDTPEQRLDKLETLLAQGTNDLSEAVPLLADLLSIPTLDCGEHFRRRHRQFLVSDCRGSMWTTLFDSEVRRDGDAPGQAVVKQHAA